MRQQSAIIIASSFEEVNRDTYNKLIPIKMLKFYARRQSKIENKSRNSEVGPNSRETVSKA